MVANCDLQLMGLRFLRRHFAEKHGLCFDWLERAGRNRQFSEGFVYMGTNTNCHG